MRIVAVLEVFRVTWTRVKARKKPSKRAARLKAERECFKGMAEAIKKDEQK